MQQPANSLYEIGNEELRKSLSKLKWDFLKTKKAEFIVNTVIKRLRKDGVQFFIHAEVKQVEVVPVTLYSKDNPVYHPNNYVYEGYRGWKGVITKEWKSSNKEICEVKISRAEGAVPVVATILKADLKEMK